MRITSHRLRSKVVKKKTVAEEDAYLKAKSERSRKHRFLLIFIGLSAALNLNTGLLTPIVFNCENFSNNCAVAYISGFATAYVISTFFISYKPEYLSIIALLMASSQFSQALLGALGSGYTAKVLYTLAYLVCGFLDPLITQSEDRAEVFIHPLLFIFILISTASYVTNRFLLNSAFSTIYIGFTSSRIALGTLQGILEKIVGTETISQCRRILFLCHTTRALLTLIGAIWAFVLYIECLNVKDDESDKKRIEEGASTGDGSPSGGSELGKWEQVVKVIPYMKHFYWRPLMFFTGSSLLFFYSPVIVPFCLNIPRPMKLLGSLLFSYGDLIGRTIGSTLDKELDDKDKSESQSHSLYIFMKDLKYILLISLVHASIISLIVMTWNNHEYSKSIAFVFCIILFGSIGLGITLTRTMNSINWAIAYFNKHKEGSDDKKIIPDEVRKYSNAMFDFVNFCDAVIMLLFALLASFITKSFEAHRTNRTYLIANNTGGLTEEIVDVILGTK